MGARSAEGGSGHLMDRRTDRAPFPSKGEGPPPRWGPQGCRGDLQLATCLVLISPTMDGPQTALPRASGPHADGHWAWSTGCSSPSRGSQGLRPSWRPHQQAGHWPMMSTAPPRTNAIAEPHPPSDSPGGWTNSHFVQNTLEPRADSGSLGTQHRLG